MNGTPNPYPTLDGDNGTSTPGAFFKELFRNKKSKSETRLATTQAQPAYEPSTATSDTCSLAKTEVSALQCIPIKERCYIRLT